MNTHCTKAILISPGINEAVQPVLTTKPSLLLNIVDKPVIFHILDQLHRLGFQTVDLILHHFPEQIEEKIGSGARWGIDVRYHLAKNPQMPLSSLYAAISRNENKAVLIGRGDSMPRFREAFENEALYMSTSRCWTGWTFTHTERLRNVPPETFFEDLPLHLKSLPEVRTEQLFSVRSFDEWQGSNRSCLEEADPSIIFPTATKKIENGIWLSRAVTMEPGVEIAPPVLIGENCLVKSGARLGPYAIIENHCIIDNGSVVENSLICQKSYVGEGLEINHCVIDRNTLINLALNTRLSIRDEFILSGSRPPALTNTIYRWAERAAGMLLFLFCLPVFLILLLKHPLKREEKVALPAPENEEQWKTFSLLTFDIQQRKDHNTWKFLKGLPRLVNILKGELSFVGTAPRSTKETKELPSDWKRLYLATKPGIITLYDSDHEDDLYAGDAYYAAKQGFWFDLKVILKTLLRRIV